MEAKVNKKSVSFHTLGCRLNFSETGMISKEFEDRGYKIVPFGEQADVIVINTCTVTGSAESKCRNAIRKSHRISPQGKIIVVGCYAQMEANTIMKMGGVKLVLGSFDKDKIFDFLAEIKNKSEPIAKVGSKGEFFKAFTTPSDDHTRAFFKIQDGCNYFCSYCIIPFARGRCRSIAVNDAIESVKELIGYGYKEVVLTGVNIGEYHGENGEKLSDLVREILKVEGLERLRLSSIEPNKLDDELLEVLKNSPKFMPHFHIPLQYGDDTVLQLMKRRYNTAEFASVVLKLQEMFSTASFGTDIIVGFPGEEESSFKNCYQLIESLPITHLHVFPYSRRKGTKAAEKPMTTTDAEKKERVKKLIELGDKKMQEYFESLVGQEHQVLFERRNKEGLWEGLTPSFVRVAYPSDENLNNQIRNITLKSYQSEKMLGE